MLTETAPAPDAAPAVESAPVAAPETSSPAPESSAPETQAPAPDYTSALEQFSNAGMDAGAGLRDKSDRAAHRAAKAEAGAAPGPGAPGAPAAQPTPAGRAPKLAEIQDPKRAAALKYMSNEAFEYWYPIALKLEKRELIEREEHDKTLAEREAALRAETQSARYWDHEEGYKLTPEFKALDRQIGVENAKRQFWGAQLQAVRAGQPFQWLNEDKDGNVTVAPGSYDPKDHPEAEGEILSRITQATTVAMGLKQKADELPKNHKASHEKFTGAVSTMRTKLFGGIKNPNFTAKSAEHLKSMPPSMQGRPEVQFLADALAAGEMFFDMYQAEKAKNAKAAKVAAATANGAPAPAAQDPALGGPDDIKARVAQLHAMTAKR